MSLSIKKVLLGTALTAGLVATGAAEALAVDITSTITADNFYGLYTGNEDGSVLDLIGRNEMGDSGNPGQYNWSEAETWNFQASRDDYLYVVTWDDQNVAESWISEFDIGDDTVLTGADDWEFITGGLHTYDSANELPGDSELNSFISQGGWADTIKSADHGDNPWGVIEGISTEADWLQTASHEEGKYTIFRTQVKDVTVPEPASLLGLLGVGALGTSLLKRKAES
ncbi:PEP-CTERM sorting domain-containing protein [Spirulina sp. CS-785/01]|uniref:PEP-CTERM sorting domain-containing protein n=1 Tax=Spirulina sp. CS-785/01 TaxID=3021716 RepID=UPI00232DE451|nr:PEP-CTERM sorting domain-containing protein [Spirulina sp. CS-785/01]MDB9315977.1 PEP-CTERM sorting domain-containing protein [Spirulina sp. CS-785/01]